MKDSTYLPDLRLEGGTRLGDAIRSRAVKPSVTIITATFNAHENLACTIKSIRELTCKDVEWIVVDSASKDGTVDLLREHEDVIDYWVSEPDGGIYDAWNKGILLAGGEWIAFMGAGDTYEPGALSTYLNAIAVSPLRPELVSSRVLLVNKVGTPLRVWGAPFKWDLFKKYMTIAHPGALHHRSLFEKHGLFDVSYSSAADYEFFMRCGSNLRAIYLDVITVVMPVGGISNSRKGFYEVYLIQKRYGAGISAKFRFWLAHAKRLIRPLLRGY